MKSIKKVLLSFLPWVSIVSANDSIPWYQFAIRAEGCITGSDTGTDDLIVFSVFEHGYKYCTDEPTGTYTISVVDYVGGYLDQMEQTLSDIGNKESSSLDSFRYSALQCIPYTIQDRQYFYQLGCAGDEYIEPLALNVYTDGSCAERADFNGLHDHVPNYNVGLPYIQVPFKQCQPCLEWTDLNDDQLDDHFYQNHMNHTLTCSTAWALKKNRCDRHCQKLVNMKRKRSIAGKILLVVGIIALVGAGVLVVEILRRRNADGSLTLDHATISEQAAMGASGLWALSTPQSNYNTSSTYSRVGTRSIDEA